MPSTDASPTLARRIGLPLLTLYGIGNLIGGGFYALVGEVAGLAGAGLPVALALAAGVAALSALSFCELAARHPSSGGPASYVAAAFGRRWLTLTVGAVVIATGIISAATLATAVDGFTQDLLPHPRWAGIAVVVAMLGGVAAWGVSQSVWLAAIITLIESGGIVYVGVMAAGASAGAEIEMSTFVPTELERWSAVLPGVLMGAFLSFYAYVGFEDLVTLAEEVERPRQNLPRAIILSLGITTLLYVVVGTLAIMVVPPDQLADSRTPLGTVVERAGGSGLALGYISVLAGANGALVQIVMGARVLYSLAGESRRFRGLGRVNAFTRTPVRATALVSSIILVLALFFPLVTLARTTSFLLLGVFAAANAALWWIKRREDPAPRDARVVPAIVPLLGALSCLAFLAIEIARVIDGAR